MAKNETIFFTKEGRLEQAAGGVSTTITTAGVDGSKLLDLRLTSGAPTSIDIQINGVTIATFNSPAVGDRLMNATPVDKNGNNYLNLPPGAAINFTPVGATVIVMAYLEDY